MRKKLSRRNNFKRKSLSRRKNSRRKSFRRKSLKRKSSRRKTMKKKSKKIGGSRNSGKCLQGHLDFSNVPRVADIIEGDEYTLYVLHIELPEIIRQSSYLQAEMRFSDIEKMIEKLYASFQTKDKDIYSAYDIMHRGTKNIVRKGPYRMSDSKCKKRIEKIDEALEHVENFLPRYYDFLMVEQGHVTNVSFTTTLNALLVGIPDWSVVYP